MTADVLLPTTAAAAAVRDPRSGHMTPAPAHATAAPLVDIAIPVYNEVATLESSLRRLHAHLLRAFPLPVRITVVDNASTDGTLDVARRVAGELTGVRVLHLPRRGRGGALRAAWLGSDSALVAYMDVDLSTDLRALLPLVAPLLSGHSDIAIGSRLAHGARVRRCARREVVSRAYNLLLRSVLRLRVRDAQCGFKAMTADCARRLLPRVRDDGWFFDTELLVLAQRSGMRVHEVPVDWVEDPDSRVDVVRTALDDLRGIARLAADGLRPRPGRRPTTVTAAQVGRFVAVGAVSTAAYAVLYTALRHTTEPVTANAVALLMTAVANTAANRRLTFGISGRSGRLRHQGVGLLAFGIALAITSTAAAALTLAPRAGRGLEVAVLVTANGVATAVRFLVLRRGMTVPARPSARRPRG